MTGDECIQVADANFPKRGDPDFFHEACFLDTLTFTLRNTNTDQSRCLNMGTQCAERQRTRPLGARLTADVFYVTLLIVLGMWGHCGRALFSTRLE